MRRTLKNTALSLGRISSRRALAVLVVAASVGIFYPGRANALLLTDIALNLQAATGSGNRANGGGLVVPSATQAAADIKVDSGAATAAVVTYAAANGRHAFSGVSWSYSAAPTGGKLTIADGSSTVYEVDITAAGPDAVFFSPVMRGTTNTALVVTLASGAGAVVGKVNVIGHWIEYP